MNNQDILMHESLGLDVNLSHQCKTENGIEPNERFKITEIIGAFDLLRIKNQYGQELIINPNQILEL